MIQEVEVVLNNDVVTVVKYGDIFVQFPSIHRDAKTIYVKYKWGQYSIVEDYTPPEEEPVENDDFERAMNSYLSKHDIFLLTSDLATTEEFEGELGITSGDKSESESSSETDNDNNTGQDGNESSQSEEEQSSDSEEENGNTTEDTASENTEENENTNGEEEGE